MDPAVLDPHRTAASRPPIGRAIAIESPKGADGDDRCPAGLCIIRSRMDTRTKWVIAILLVLVLAFLVIGAIIAIATPPDNCC